MKKTAAIVLLVLFAAAPSEAQPKLYKGKITIGTAIWPGYLGLYVAQEKGYFKKAGLDVEVKLELGLAEVSREYVAGKIQGRANLVFDAVKERLGGFDHKAVLAFDYSNGSDAILAGKEIGTVGDFKGKRVGYEFGTMEEFFLKWALTESGLELSDIVPVNAEPEEAVKMLTAGRVDVAVSYEPFISKYALSGDFHVVTSSADFPGLIMDILTFRTDFVQTHPDTVQAIVDAYFEALDFWKAHPEEAQAILAKDFGTTSESIAEQLQGVKILDQRDNQNVFTFAAGLQSLYGNLRRVGSFINRREQGARPVLDTDTLVEKKFVKRSHG